MSTENQSELTSKGAAIQRGALLASEGDIGDALRRMALALSWLTSPSLPHREAAKKRVREWVRSGN